MSSIDLHRHSKTQHGDRGSLLERPNAQRCFQYKSTAKRLQQRHLPETASLYRNSWVANTDSSRMPRQKDLTSNQKLRKIIFDSGKFPCYNPVIFTLPASAGYSSTRSIRGFLLQVLATMVGTTGVGGVVTASKPQINQNTRTALELQQNHSLTYQCTGRTGIQHSFTHLFLNNLSRLVRKEGALWMKGQCHQKI